MIPIRRNVLEKSEIEPNAIIFALSKNIIALVKIVS